MDRPVPSLKTRQRFRLVSTPHAGPSDAQTAALGLDGLAKSLSPIRAVGEYLAWLVRQGLRSGFAIIHVCGRNCDSLDQSRAGVGADMRLEAIDRRPAFVFDPARLVVAFARGGNDGGVDKRSCLGPDRLGPELGGDLVEQRLVQVLSDEGFPEPNEGGALRRSFIPREPAIVPTLAVAILTRPMRCEIGVMISASHNRYEDNGVKLFGRTAMNGPTRSRRASKL